MTDQTKPTIAVWFSCGAASAVAARETLRLYGANHNIRIINNPVIEEGYDNRRFLADIEAWLGVKIEVAIHPKYPNASASEVWEKRRYMSGVRGAPCTSILKKEARQIWEKNNPHDYLVLGFHAGEEKRASRFKMTERDNLLCPLIDLNITKQDCRDILDKAGIRLPDAYSKGLPNANCIGCVKSTSIKYWKLIREHYPDVFFARADQSRRIGARLIRINGNRVFLDALPSSSLELNEDLLDNPDCGIFCEERDQP